MKGILIIVIIIGLLAITNINKINKTFIEKDNIKATETIVSLAKKTVSKKKILTSQVDLLNETNKIKSVEKQNASTLIEMAKKVNKEDTSI